MEEVSAVLDPLSFMQTYIFFLKYKTPAEFVESCRIKESLLIKIHFYDCELLIVLLWNKLWTVGSSF